MRSSAFRLAGLILVAAGFLILFPSSASAQILGRLEGVVTDEAGNPMEGVEVYLKNVTTNAELKPAKTRKTGKYLFMTEPASYIMWAHMEGYVVARQYVEITNSDGAKSTSSWFYDPNQIFDKPVRLLPAGDMNSKVKNKVDFLLTTPAKQTAVVNRLYAEYRGEKPPPEAGGEGAPQEPQKKSSFESAIELLAQKDYGGAIPFLQKATEEDPEDPESYYQLGRAAIETENYGEAETALKKAKQLDPTKPGVSFHLARLYDKKSRKVQAITALEEEKALSPDSEAVLESLAVLYMDTGQNDKAIETYNGMIASHPDHLDAYLALATIYKNTGDKVKEEEMYKTVGDRDPSGDALYNLGTLAFNNSETDKASVYYKQVLDRNPDHAKAHLQLAYTMVNLGDFPGAISHFETFLKLTPNDPKAAEAKAVMSELKKMAGKSGGKS